MEWDCDKCGTTHIAPDVKVCPHCGADPNKPEPKPAEEKKPAATPPPAEAPPAAKPKEN